MKAFSILIFVLVLNTSTASDFKLSLKYLTPKSADDKRSFLTRNTDTGRHLPSQDGFNFENIRDYNARKYQKRFRYPHQHRYTHRYRKSKPAFHYEVSPERSQNNNRYLKYIRSRTIDNKLLNRPTPGFRQTYLKQRYNRNSNNVSYPFSKLVNGFQSTLGKNGVGSQHRIYQKNSKDSRRTINDTNTRALIQMNIDPADIFDSTNASQVKEKRSESTKARHSTIFGNRNLYHNLGRFDFLYLLGLFMIFIPIASISVFILPIITFCWKNCKREKSKEKDAMTNDSAEITVESALVGDKANKVEETKSYDDMYRTFVSNDFNGDGDSVAKRMKLDRFTPQVPVVRQKKQRKVHRNYNSVDMELTEQQSEEASNQNFSQQSSQDESDEPDKQHDYSLTNPGRNHFKSQNTSGNKRVDKNESQTFNLRPNRSVTVGRVHNVYPPTNPRQIYSNVQHIRGPIPKRDAHSMVDLKQYRR